MTDQPSGPPDLVLDARRLRELCANAWHDGARAASVGTSLTSFPHPSPTTAAHRLIGLSWLREWQHGARSAVLAGRTRP